ncbi:hypothetical protein [Roseisalinus antarcticus]|uniref:hypothetical protein n=1 Tax=Roseisalinus antarcticus TaxID=254357 RepID=UPI0013564AC6|nr:hypothetical protein [Roseisalinus antarcticus]
MTAEVDVAVEALLFLVDAALVAGLACWMIVAVADNWRHPRMNEDGVAMVVRLDDLARDYPEDYKMIAHRPSPIAASTIRP